MCIHPSKKSRPKSAQQVRKERAARFDKINKHRKKIFDPQSKEYKEAMGRAYNFVMKGQKKDA